MTQTWINGTITLKMGATAVRYSTRQISPYKTETDVDDSHL